jgi:hypothetical protein
MNKNNDGLMTISPYCCPHDPYAPFTSHHMTARRCDVPAKRLLEPQGISCLLRHQISTDDRFMPWGWKKVMKPQITPASCRRRCSSRHYDNEICVAPRL